VLDVSVVVDTVVVEVSDVLLVLAVVVDVPVFVDTVEL
jgi:hypothetical protein